MKKKKAKHIIYISVMSGEQTEVAIAIDDVVSEYYIELLHQRKTKGNIYKGVVNNLDTNLQAAFINYGAEKNGFLQIDELHPEYYRNVFTPTKTKKYPLIQKVLRPGDEILVQIVKEATPQKGAFLTSYPSLVGRYFILTPGQEQKSLSRKIEEEEARKHLFQILEDIDPGKDFGVILRTSSTHTTKLALLRDLQFLKRLWKTIIDDVQSSVAPALVYQEPTLARRAIRDFLTEEITQIIVDDKETFELVKEYVTLLFPRKAKMVEFYNNAQIPLFIHSGLQQQIEQIYSREVELPSGGRLVFDQTEALMAIDINSGKITGKSNFEAMALKINLEAAEIIAKQLRLKDIGGQIIIDFIEMKEQKHWAEVERTIKQAMKVDKARYEIGKISSFGLMQIIRQRMGLSALSTLSELCPYCSGTGVRANMEWQATTALKEINRLIQNSQEETCIYRTTEEVGLYLLNKKRFQLLALEEEYNKYVQIEFLHPTTK